MIRVAHRHIAQEPDRSAIRYHFTGEGLCAGGKVAFDDPGEQRGLGKVGGPHRLAAHNHVDCRLESAGTRQTLRSAGSGNQAEFHLRQADTGFGSGYAEVAGQRELEPPAEAGAGNRGNGGFQAALEGEQQGRQVRVRDHLRRLNSFTSAPPEKNSPVPMSTIASIAGSASGPRELAGEALAHGVRQRIDGWVVELDDSYIAVRERMHGDRPSGVT